MKDFFGKIVGAVFGGEKKIYVLLCLLSLILYFRWVNFDVFSYGDWSYKYTQNLKELLSGSTWITNTDFGSFNELLWRAPLDFLFGIFAALGMTISVSEKFLIFLPIAVTSTVAPYFLLRQLSFKPFHAVLGALFYATNTYFLSINPQGHGLLILAGNLLTLSFGLFIRAIDTNSARSYVLSAIFLWLTSVADFRLFYIGAMLFAGYVAYQWVFLRKKPSKHLFTFGVLTILFQIGWLLATAATQAGGSDAILSRSLFGGGYWDLPSALTLHYPFWTGKTTSWFIINEIPLYFWLIPAAAIASLYINRKEKMYVFFGAMAVLGILLSKQTNDPFPGLYPFLYQNLPGFSAFRESTKFYYFILLAYTVLITGLIAYLAQHKNKAAYRFAVIGVGFFIVINALPYLTGTIGKLLQRASIPDDYQTIAKQLESDNSNYYRTLWVPIAPRWSYYSTQHPRINSTSLTRLPISPTDDGQTVKTAQQLKDLVSAPLFQEYISALSVRYVFVPLRDTANKDDFFKFYGDDRQFYIDALDKIDFLKRVDLGTKDVVVYENSRYKPYITAADSLTSLDSPQNLDSDYGFMHDHLGKSSSFVINSEAKKLPTVSNRLMNIFGDIEEANISKGLITKQVETTNSSKLYTAKSPSPVSYSVANNKLSLFSETGKTSLKLDGKDIQNSSSGSQQLFTATLKKNQQYMLAFNNMLLPVETTAGNHLLGTNTGEVIKLVSISNANLTENGSFESGLWHEQVRDCNPYDNSPNILMSLDDKDAVDGKKSLLLRTSSHIACTDSAAAKVTPGKTYMVSFRYQAPYAERVSFRVNFDNGSGQTFNVNTKNASGQWRIHRELVTIPSNTSTATIQLHGLPLPNYSNSNFLAKTSYDDVSLQEAVVLSSVQAKSDSTQQFDEGLSITPGKHTLTYANDSIDNVNLFKNGGFESNLWQGDVDDCASNIDDLDPIIGMSVSSSASQGEKSLQLSAQRHVACTNYQAIKVEQGKTYLLSFDHQSPNTKTASYSISFNDEQKTTIGDYTTTGKAWQRYSKSITVPVGASELTIKVYARSYSNTPEATVNRYDNFHLLKAPDLSSQYYLFEQASTPLVKPGSVDFRTSRTQKSVAIHGATKPFYLTMSEAYNASWIAQATSGNTKVVLENYKITNFGNAWYIDPEKLCTEAKDACSKNSDGSYEINLSITFASQRLFMYGTMAGLAALAGCIVYLIISKLRSRNEPVRHRKRK